MDVFNGMNFIWIYFVITQHESLKGNIKKRVKKWRLSDSALEKQERVKR